MTPNEFKAYRAKLKLTQSQLAGMMECDQVTIRRWEMSPDTKSARKIPGPAVVLIKWLGGNKPKMPKKD